MWKLSLIMVTVLFAFLFAMFTITPASKRYWEAIGPNWDRMLNPCKYQNCEEQ